MLKASGKFLITNNSVRIVLDTDFCRYYQWLFNRGHFFTKKTQIPKYGAHINIASPKIHKNCDTSNVKKLNGKRVDFYYDYTGNYGGFTKGFLNFWFDVDCEKADEIADILGLPSKDINFARFHLTICSTKGI